MTHPRHSRLGLFVRMLALWLVTALAFLVLAALLPGIAVPSFDGALVTTALIAILNRLLWPLLTRLFLPITVLTLGLGTLVGNALIISVAIDAVDGSSPNFWAAPATAPPPRAKHDGRPRGDPFRDRRAGRARAAPCARRRPRADARPLAGRW